MRVFQMKNGETIPVLGVSQSPLTTEFCEKEILAAIIAVEDILNMEGFSLGEDFGDWGSERRGVFQLYDNEGEYAGEIYNESFSTLLDVVERLERHHKEKLLADYDEFAENGLDSPDPMVAKALILIENHTYIQDLLGSVDANVRAAMKEKYYGKDGSENIKRTEALFNYGPSDSYVGIDSLGRLDIDALGYLVDRLIAAKIMDTQGAYEVIEYNEQLCEVYVDNGDIGDFVDEIDNGTLLECEGVCAYDSYQELIDAQKAMILEDFRDIGLYDDQRNWNFYLTEKELVHIGLGDALEKEKAEYIAETPAAPSLSVDERLANAVARGEEMNAENMREFLKKHNHPQFAEYFDNLSPEELRAEYLECQKTFIDANRDVGDDWAQRRESLAARNLGFH